VEERGTGFPLREPRKTKLSQKRTKKVGFAAAHPYGVRQSGKSGKRILLRVVKVRSGMAAKRV